MGIPWEDEGDQFLIFGQGRILKPVAPSTFDPDQDHRMVMAATLAQHLGFPIDVLHPSLVKKSFPNFFEIVGPA